MRACEIRTSYKEVADAFGRLVRPRDGRPDEAAMSAWEAALRIGPRNDDERWEEWNAALETGDALFRKGGIELPMEGGHLLRLEKERDEVYVILREAGSGEYAMTGTVKAFGKDSDGLANIYGFWPYEANVRRPAGVRLGKPLLGILVGGLLADGAQKIKIEKDTSAEKRGGQPEGGFYSWTAGMIPGPIDLGTFEIGRFREAYGSLKGLETATNCEKYMEGTILAEVIKRSLKAIGREPESLSRLDKPEKFAFSFYSPYLTSEGPSRGFRLPMDGVATGRKCF